MLFAFAVPETPLVGQCQSSCLLFMLRTDLCLVSGRDRWGGMKYLRVSSLKSSSPGERSRGRIQHPSRRG